MKNFNVRKGVFLKDKNSTEKIMYHLLISLIPFIIYSTYRNGIYPVIKGYGNLYTTFKPLIYTALSSTISLFTEYIYYILKKSKKSLNYLITESFAIIPGVFLSLIVSLDTPIWLLSIGSLIASLSKVIMGGFGKNKLNPALVGSIFITVIFVSLTNGYQNIYELDIISSTTSSSDHVITYESLITPYGSLLNLFLGNIPIAIGEASNLLCIISFVYLLINKAVKWRITTSYVLTVVTISAIICVLNNFSWWFIIFNVLSGGLLFGAVFMATDPITTPITAKGQIVGGVFLGMITMLIRYLTPFSEGVLISILLLNILTIIINNLSIKLYDKRLFQNVIMTIFIIIIIPISLIIHSTITNESKDNTQAVYKVSKSSTLV